MEKAHASEPWQHTKYPYVTGTSVIAIKFQGGVMIAAYTLGYVESLQCLETRTWYMGKKHQGKNM
jgi:20S proteasome alpha/beta subunit